MVTYTSQIATEGNCEFVKFQIDYSKNYEGLVPSSLVSELYYKSEEATKATVYFWHDTRELRFKLKKAKKKGSSNIPAEYNGEKLTYFNKGILKQLTVEDIFQSVKRT